VFFLIAAGAVYFFFFDKPAPAPLSLADQLRARRLTGTYTQFNDPSVTGGSPLVANPNAPNFGG